MKYGFEREFFLWDDEKQAYVLADKYPHDACGFLVEARGEPNADPLKAAVLLEYECQRLAKLVEPLRLRLDLQDFVVLPRTFRSLALRRFGKGVSDTGSMYGKFWGQPNLSRAGLHVHFSDQYKDHNGYDRPGIIDIPRYVFGLDKLFAAEIRVAKRVPGLYELKAHGFEYRSLPASMNPYRVAKAIQLLNDERWTAEMSV